MTARSGRSLNVGHALLLGRKVRPWSARFNLRLGMGGAAAVARRSRGGSVAAARHVECDIPRAYCRTAEEREGSLESDQAFIIALIVSFNSALERIGHLQVCRDILKPKQRIYYLGTRRGLPCRLLCPPMLSRSKSKGQSLPASHGYRRLRQLDIHSRL